MGRGGTVGEGVDAAGSGIILEEAGISGVTSGGGGVGDFVGEQAAITPRMTTSTVKLGKSPRDRKSWGWIINRLTGSVWLWAWPSVIALMSSRKICLPQIWSVKAVVRPTVYPLCCTTVAVQAVYR